MSLSRREAPFEVMLVKYALGTFGGVSTKIQYKQLNTIQVRLYFTLFYQRLILIALPLLVLNLVELALAESSRGLQQRTDVAHDAQQH